MIALRDAIKKLDEPTRQAMRDELQWAAKSAYKAKIRTRVQFARAVLRIPEGKHEGSLWRPEFQPFAYLLLKAMDESGKRRFAVTGCVQSGKTLICVVLNVLWHLFERKQSVIFIIPELTMAEKKWKDEIEPVIRKSRWLRKMAYGSASRDAVPSGGGSKGGFKNVIRFANGTRLEFMGAMGSDARRSSSTAPVVVKTEVDRMDTAAESSREASAAMTIEDRTESYGDAAYIYEECTMTTESGRINKQVRAGTNTTPHGPCPHCDAYVRVLREHLVGYQECSNDLEAREQGRFCCPNCGETLTPRDREVMQTRSIAVSRGQTVKVGTDGAALIEGELPQTEIFSFWWNAWDNRFWSTHRLAMKEWNAMYSDSPDDEDKQSRQKRWAEPAVSNELDLTRLTMRRLTECVSELRAGIVPDGTKWLTSALDVGATYLHFSVKAWRLNNDKLQGQVIDLGRMEVFSKELGVEDAVLDALRRYRDERLRQGYFDNAGNKYLAGWTLIDSGWREKVIWAFVLECVQMGLYTIVPIIGRGQSDPGTPGSYRHPEKVDDMSTGTGKIAWIGDECHLRKSSRYAPAFASVGCPHPPLYVVCNSDELKSYVREGYQNPDNANGALRTFKPTTKEERELIQQFRKELLAETEHQKYLEGRGVVSLWRNVSRRKNHYGDAEYYQVPAVQLCGAPVTVRRNVVPPIPEKTADGSHVKMPDGRHYMTVDKPQEV